MHFGSSSRVLPEPSGEALAWERWRPKASASRQAKATEPSPGMPRSAACVVSRLDQDGPPSKKNPSPAGVVEAGEGTIRSPANAPNMGPPRGKDMVIAARLK